MKYRFGISVNRELVDVTTLDRKSAEAQGPFLCVECRGPLVAKTKGRLREKHFAHQADACGGESYLHLTAKLLFQQTYKSAVKNGTPFLIEFDAHTKCPKNHHGEKTTVFRDITDAVPNVFVEQSIGKWRADILLAGANRQLIVEIAHTHSVESDKIESGLPIVEVFVREESDLNPIIKGELHWDATQLHNIKPIQLPISVSQCEECHKPGKLVTLNSGWKPPKLDTSKWLLFVVRPDGKCFVRLMKKENPLHAKMQAIRDGALVAEIYPKQQSSWKQWKKLARKAVSDGVPVKSCLVCNNGELARTIHENGPFWCYLKKRHYSTRKALTCRDWSQIQSKSAKRTQDLNSESGGKYQAHSTDSNERE